MSGVALNGLIQVIILATQKQSFHISKRYSSKHNYWCEYQMRFSSQLFLFIDWLEMRNILDGYLVSIQRFQTAFEINHMR